MYQFRRERRVHLSGRERLRLLHQSRHLIDELTTTGADRLCDGLERSQVRARAARGCVAALGA